MKVQGHSKLISNGKVLLQSLEETVSWLITKDITSIIISIHNAKLRVILDFACGILIQHCVICLNWKATSVAQVESAALQHQLNTVQEPAVLPVAAASSQTVFL